MGNICFTAVPSDNIYYYKAKEDAMAVPAEGDYATFMVNRATIGTDIPCEVGDVLYICSKTENNTVENFTEITVTESDIKSWPEDTKTKLPVADAWSRSNNPDQNTGTWVNIDVSTTLWGYFKFDISDVESSSISKFRIWLEEVNYKGNGRLYLFGCYDNSWQETGITHNNKPGISTDYLDTVVARETGRYYEFDVSSYIMDQKALGKNEITLVLMAADSTEYFKFSSKEMYVSSQRPQLLIAPAIDEPIIAPNLAGIIWDKGSAISTTKAAYMPQGLGELRYYIGEKDEISRPVTGSSAEIYSRTL